MNESQLQPPQLAPVSILDLAARLHQADSSRPPPENWKFISRAGYPFSGKLPPRMPTVSEEAEALKTVKKYKVRFFNLEDPKQKQEYEDILTAAISGLYVLFVHKPPDNPVKPIGYLEWAEIALEVVRPL